MNYASTLQPGTDHQLSPTREGTVEAELKQLQERTTQLGDALQELRSRLSVVLRNSPVAAQVKQSDAVGKSPCACTIAVNIARVATDIERFIVGVKETTDLLDLN